MQKDFAQYKQDSAQIAEAAKTSHLMLEKTPWLFIFIGVAISATATYYLSEQGLRNSDLYRNLIGAENTAWLVVGIMEGSLIALIYGMTTFLKSSEQRRLAAMGINALKAILCLNLIAAFALWVTKDKSSAGLVELYAQWGTPITICAALWFWPKILNLRHQDLQRAAVLDQSAKIADQWRIRHIQDQDNYLSAYSEIQDSPEMQEAQRAIAEYEAIQQLATERGIPFEAAQAIFERARTKKTEGTQRQFNFQVAPVRQIGMAPPAPATAQRPGLGNNFYDPNAPK